LCLFIILMEQQIRIWQAISWKTISDRSKDLAIALVIATIGLAGSYIILGRSIRSEVADNSVAESPSLQNKNAFSSDSRLPLALKTSHEDLLVIQGSFFANQILTVSYTDYKPGHQYMIDFGNGLRQLCRNNVSYVNYQEPGNYYIIFYEMLDSRWQIVSSQSITIKS